MMPDETHDLAALYVVDALSPEETEDFENHLADCVECQEEVADMRSVTDQLSRSVQAEPPASLRSAVLAGIATTSQEPATPVQEARAAAPAVSLENDNVITLRPRWRSRIPNLVAAASVLLALGFGGWALQSHHDADQATSAQAQLVSLFGAGDVRTVSGSVPGGGSGTVVLSKTRDQAMFVSAAMPALPSNKVYELWTVTGKSVPAGTFTPGSSGSLVVLPTAALSAKRIAVTVEPRGGSPAPTTTPVMVVDVPQSS